MKILITGGAGYIGSHTAKLLSHCSLIPVVVDDLSTGHRWAAKWGPIVEGNLADTGLIRQVLATHKVGAAIHFAASAYVGESMENPRKYFRNNVINTLNLLDALIDAGLAYVVFSSTCATYGTPAEMPIPENHIQDPINPYGESKRFVERVLHWYGRAYGLKWVALRYFNAAGADPEGEIGEEHDPETHMVPIAIQAALGKRPYMEVFGTDYPTPDGTAIRDYTHVTDLARAHLLALRYLLGGGKSTAVNLGTGNGHSVRKVIRAVERVSGRRVPVREAARRPGDPPVLVADSGKACQLLGWQPQFSSLDAIVETAWNWHSRETKAHSMGGLTRGNGR
ncbi:MAG: UDP-glucose 4-epimerase GalE [Candidatus Rokubacteria bacterium 13_1_40CM_2_68_8]|nr:MAG: UDP-glucose 4-epimerase GalE [Gemmatimonadetes bacterium 13_1_40CM_4_69_8]OLD38763.1 MAG: UDP-glucose 4-epimerase GalE [Candidatus Rokubacteria bacterium 13_1_40CM_2_68_8]